MSMGSNSSRVLFVLLNLSLEKPNLVYGTSNTGHHAMSMMWIAIPCETLCVALGADLVAYPDVLVYAS